jgi:hypothetical protein
MQGRFGRTGTAVLRIADETGVQALIINPSLGKTKEVLLPPKTDDFPRPSPAVPLAALAGPDGSCKDEVRFLHENGDIDTRFHSREQSFYSMD